MMMATLMSRKPVPREPVAPVSDVVPWGTPYVPGGYLPSAMAIPAGNYTLDGKVCGCAHVTLDGTTVAVAYDNFSDDGLNIIHGAEKVTVTSTGSLQHVDWYSNMTSTGDQYSTKLTSEGGFHLFIDLLVNLFEANGTLTTTVDGVVFKQPANGT